MDLIRFDPAEHDTPEKTQTVLGAQSETAKTAHFADRDNTDLKATADDAMQEYADARRWWREVGIAAGTRNDGVGVNTTNNTDEGA